MEGVWKGLFEWSMKHNDGTTAPRAIPEEDREWLEEALKMAMVDLGKRMEVIKDHLDQPVAGEGGEESTSGGAGGASTSLSDKELLLDELMEIVESIDHAKDLATIGGLPTLLALLQSPHPSLRWRAAEVCATCVQNNPPVQRSFLDGGIMPRVLPLLRDEDATVRVKALLALSCMVRGCPPALVAFRQDDGLRSLVAMLEGDEPRVQRKCLQIIQYFLRSIPQDRPAALAACALPALCAVLAGGERDLREAALAVAAELARDGACLARMQGDEALRAQVRELQMQLDTLDKPEWAEAEDEVAAVKALSELLEAEPAQAASAAAASPPAAQDISARRVAVVDDSTTTGASPSALQMVPVQPAAEEEGAVN